MPPARNTPPSSGTTNLPSTGLELPEELRQELLKAQAESVQSAQRPPQVKILLGGVNLFQFADEPEAPVSSFKAVVLHAQPRQVLWMRDEGQAEEGGNKPPACISEDARTGTPAADFAHPALGGAVATGTESIACARCPFNQAGSWRLAGKATGSQYTRACNSVRAVYLAVPGRAAPVQLNLSITSAVEFDKFVARATNTGKLLLQHMVKISLVAKTGNGNRWSQAEFALDEALTQEAFNNVYAMRGQYAWLWNPDAPRGGEVGAGLRRVVGHQGGR